MAVPNGTSAKDLSEALKAVTLEDLALRLDRIEAMMTAPRDPVKEIRQIAAAGSVTVRELRARGYTALQVRPTAGWPWWQGGEEEETRAIRDIYTVCV